jgi:hypothetical protein
MGLFFLNFWLEINFCPSETRLEFFVGHISELVDTHFPCGEDGVLNTDVGRVRSEDVESFEVLSFVVVRFPETIEVCFEFGMLEL